MGSVWKRLQRVNKRAAKFQFTASYHELHLETTAKWRPSNLAVVWTRRSRRVASAPLPWEPDMMNPLVGHISWPVPDNHAISVTLFKDPRTHELEDKDWTFVIEDITHLGKKRVLASAAINMRKYASIESTQQSFLLTLKPVSRKITSASLELTLSCVFLREGKATDEDMQSVVSLMSVNNNCDVAPLDDLEDIPDLESSGDISDHLYDFTQQLEQMTTSLNGCIDLPTPLSVPSLSEDPTPLAEVNRLNFELESDKQFEDGEVDSLKTPNASLTQQNVDRRQEQQSTTVPKEMLTPAKQQQKDLTTKQTTVDNFKNSNIFTSTPIAENAEKRSGISHVLSESERKALSFNGAAVNKQNGDISKLSFTESPKPAEQTTSTTIKSPNKKETDSFTCNMDQTTASIKTITADVNKSASAEHKAADNSSTTQPARLETKRAELQPLNLKKNYEPETNKTTTAQQSNNVSNTSTNSHSNSNSSTTKPVEKIILKENTPGQDLLEWCKEVTRDTPNVKVTNLTTSWRNGMAFCAIIHHFEPGLIDMTKLTAHDVVGNCRIAFDAAESLGIPRVIEPRDMSLLAVPDKLAVMTYLHQLRAHFTGKQLQIEQIGPTSDESSYVIGNYKSDNLSSQNLLNLSHLKAQLLHQNSFDDDIFGIDKTQLSPTAKKDVKNLILSGSKSILGKVLSPTKDKNSINALQHQTPTTVANDMNTNGDDADKLNTSNQENISQNSQQKPLQQQQVAVPLSPTSLDPNTANKIISRHKEMSEKAKLMMEKLKFSSADKNEHDEERQQRLREQARRLILETRTKGTSNGGPHSLESPTSPTKVKRFNFSPERAISPIHNGIEDYSVGSGSGSGSPKLHLSPTKKITPPRDVDTSNNKLSPSHRLSERFNGSNSLQSFNAVIDRISPKTEKKGDKLSYIESELEALEREQEAIDKKASSLEEKLRAVMGGNPSNNRISRNPFIRLIRNSIGGGDSIRIKLLDMDNDEFFSLTPSGATSPTISMSSSSSSSASSSPYTSDDDRVIEGSGGGSGVGVCVNNSFVKETNLRVHRKSRKQRPRSQSCFVEAHPNRHQNSSIHPYRIMMSTASSNHSSCDNLKVYSDEENTHTHTHKRRRRVQHRHHTHHHKDHPNHKYHNEKHARSRSNCGETEETEEQLLSQWFTLVNKKNALLRRQMQLNILEQESDLERKYTMLNDELRAAQAVEDWRKTEVQREKERLLLEELVAIVDKRDQLVQHLHNQEIAIEDDHEIARELEQVDISGGKEKCVIQ